MNDKSKLLSLKKVSYLSQIGSKSLPVILREFTLQNDSMKSVCDFQPPNLEIIQFEKTIGKAVPGPLLTTRSTLQKSTILILSNNAKIVVKILVK